MKIKQITSYGITIIFGVFLLYSQYSGIEAGIEMAQNYTTYFHFIVSVMPGVFLLIGLFNVWVKRETIEKQMGEKSGARGYLWALLLSGTAIGGLFAVLPVALTLFKKGAKLSVILTYLGTSCVCRVPMTLWEISMLGYQFTLIRYIVSIPLIILSSILIEKVFYPIKRIEQMREIDLI